jgi:hypothetical protein
MPNAYRITLGLKDQNGAQFHVSEREYAVECVASRFDAFSLTEGQGYWRGTPEPVYHFEIIGGDSIRDAVVQTARDLALIFKQECVLYSETPLGTTVLVAQDETDDYSL